VQDGKDTVRRSEVTGLLLAWGAGDEQALERLTPLVYQELHRLATSYIARERQDHTLQATTLVQEAYMRLVDLDWRDRAHFFALAARMMRRILVDFARARVYQKRAGGGQRVSLDDSALLSERARVHGHPLSEIDPRKSQIVELRFFGGLSVEETGKALQISAVTVMRDWRTAKAWLHLQLNAGSRVGP
jgi:RNA polymerase sigma factor (TIGR02999 family)